MVRALSIPAKARKAREDLEERLSDAVAAYLLAKTRGDKVTYRVLGQRFRVPLKTIQRHVNNQAVTKLESAATRSRLSPEESKTVLENTIYLAQRGVPVTPKAIAKRAWAIISAKEGPNAVPLGINWGDRFITRNRKQLQLYWGSRIDTKRGRAVNPSSNKDYWDTIQEIFTSRKIKGHRKWGADEIGIEMGYTPKRRVVGPRGQKIQHDQGDANREMVTVMNTICADGTYLKPTVVYKGKNFLSRWGKQNNPLEAM